MNVTLSWDSLKTIPNYQDVAGDYIFNEIFELDPNIRVIFGYDLNEHVPANPKFWTHARAMVEMIDCAVAFLGPDLEP